MMRYRVERRLAKPASFADFYEESRDEWALITVANARPHPASIGMVGSEYGERVRVVADSLRVVDIYEWVPRVPLNPADIHCTDFTPGWKLVKRDNPPTPSADELAHFFTAE
jgi:hypothetical protein